MEIMNVIQSYLADPAAASRLTQSIATFVLLVLPLIAAVSFKLILKRVAKRLISWQPKAWGGNLYLLNPRLIRTLSYLIAVFMLKRSVTRILAAYEVRGEFVGRLFTAATVGLILVAVTNLLNATERIYSQLPLARARPMKAVVQLFTIFFFIIGAVLILAILFNQPVWGLVSGIGALSAVFLLVFKDPLLGVAASFQIGANNMVSIGDWIEMPKYNADGDVIDISLQTVKVRNWDKTITTIPIYALVSDSFKNWRGMTESGGRRIKRPILIDLKSICFCDAIMIERFRKVQFLTDYVTAKERELEQYNREHNIDPASPVNGRRLTNIGTFRAYLQAYLAAHPGINHEMITMVRQLQPTPEGLPLEIYAFTQTTAWVAYEGVQADIFDHVLAVLSEFGLRAYQQPSGWDIEGIGASALRA